MYTRQIHVYKANEALYMHTGIVHAYKANEALKADMPKKKAELPWAGLKPAISGLYMYMYMCT